MYVCVMDSLDVTVPVHARTNNNKSHFLITTQSHFNHTLVGPHADTVLTPRPAARQRKECPNNQATAHRTKTESPAGLHNELLEKPSSVVSCGGH